MHNTEKSKIKRAPKRAIYDADEIYGLLDKEYLCHVGFIHNGSPVVIPTLYGRKGDNLYVHGATMSRLMTELEKGIEVSVSVANVTGLVLARSAFNHSMNYESVVIFGKGYLVAGEEKYDALKVISDQVLQQRWEEAREPNKTELKATKVIQIKIEEASAKVRTGKPLDDKKDYDLDVWAGVVPINKSHGAPIPDPDLKEGIEMPQSVKTILNLL